MKFLILGIIFSSSIGFAAPGENGGDVVNNGGGLSEQAIMFAVHNYGSFTESCLRYESCGLKEPVKAYLKNVQQCSVPTVAAVRFATPAESSDLAPGKAYAASAKGGMILNREMLYSVDGEPLRAASAFGYLSRIYFDYCGSLPFVQSEQIAEKFAQFAEADGERVTIGKDSIKLPSQQWIRIRTMYSDLLIEAPNSFLRLSCAGSLQQCTLLENAQPSLSRFKNLSLAQESLQNGVLKFEVQGTFLNEIKDRRDFKLEAEYKDGDVLNIKLQGQTLELPK